MIVYNVLMKKGKTKKAVRAVKRKTYAVSIPAANILAVNVIKMTEDASVSISRQDILNASAMLLDEPAFYKKVLKQIVKDKKV